MSSDKGLTYRDAGVDIEAGNALVERIKPMVRRTLRPEVLLGLGGFGGLFALPRGLEEPVLVAGTDGVGTKLKLAQQTGCHDTIGIDLVAMCVNDVLVQGAEPLFFLDYFATGKLDNDVAAAVIDGIARGCEAAGCALIGGETAEMPDFYRPGEYDLAGFNVGVVERSRLITGENIGEGDLLVGLPSSGPHSNGYSLIRRIVEARGADLGQTFGGTTLGDALLAPTEIYAGAVADVLARVPVHGMAHITGGGLRENIVRVVPRGLGVEIDLAGWQRPPIFDWLAGNGPVAEEEMLATFNCGIGYVFVVEASQVDALEACLAARDRPATVIGRVVRVGDGESRVNFLGTAP